MFDFEIGIHWYWWSIGILLVMLQIFVEDVFFLSMAAAAAIVGLIVMLFPDWGPAYQLFVFSILSVVTILIARRYMKSRGSDHPFLNQRGGEYIGSTVTLSEPIVNGSGTVKLDGVSWRVRGPDCAAGTVVKVVDLDGIVLRVEIT